MIFLLLYLEDLRAMYVALERQGQYKKQIERANYGISLLEP